VPRRLRKVSHTQEQPRVRAAVGVACASPCNVPRRMFTPVCPAVLSFVLPGARGLLLSCPLPLAPTRNGSPYLPVPHAYPILNMREMARWSREGMLEVMRCRDVPVAFQALARPAFAALHEERPASHRQRLAYETRTWLPSMKRRVPTGEWEGGHRRPCDEVVGVVCW